jgi:peptide deformylase
VKKVTDDTRQLAREMLSTMYHSAGLGLAAEQIGRTESICVIDVPADQDKNAETGLRENPTVTMPLILINPQIIEMTGEQTGREGCLSFPDITVTIRRAREVTVTFADLDGCTQTLKAQGLLARAVQHEVDHLNGVLLVDRMSTVQRIAVGGKLRRLKKESEAALAGP